MMCDWLALRAIVQGYTHRCELVHPQCSRQIPIRLVVHHFLSVQPPGGGHECAPHLERDGLPYHTIPYHTVTRPPIFLYGVCYCKDRERRPPVPARAKRVAAGSASCTVTVPPGRSLGHCLRLAHCTRAQSRRRGAGRPHATRRRQTQAWGSNAQTQAY